MNNSRSRCKTKGDWFESYIGYEIFKRDKGYNVLQCGQLYGVYDAGIDLVAIKNGEVYLIQAKHWRKGSSIFVSDILKFFGAAAWFHKEFSPDCKTHYYFLYTCDIDEYAKKAANILGIYTQKIAYPPNKTYYAQKKLNIDPKMRVEHLSCWLRDNGIQSNPHHKHGDIKEELGGYFSEVESTIMDIQLKHDAETDKLDAIISGLKEKMSESERKREKEREKIHELKTFMVTQYKKLEEELKRSEKTSEVLIWVCSILSIILFYCAIYFFG